MQDLKLPELKPVIISVGSFVVLFLLKKNSVFDKLDCFCNPGINHLVICCMACCGEMLNFNAMKNTVMFGAF